MEDLERNRSLPGNYSIIIIRVNENITFACNLPCLLDALFQGLPMNNYL